jgi:hypothetical protein
MSDRSIRGTIETMKPSPIVALAVLAVLFTVLLALVMHGKACKRVWHNNQKVVGITQ